MKAIVAISAITAAVTILVVAAALLLLLQYRPHIFGITLPDPDASSAGNGPDTAPAYEAAVRAAVAKADPAVVAITVSVNVPVYERYFESIPSPFGRLNIPRVRQRGTELKEVGGGSGFLVSPDGYIVTNRHVVADEEAQYTVFTNDGQAHPAQVMARHAELDIAVLKIDGAGFAHLAFGDSDELHLGQTVIAIGNALAEFRNTVSVGVVSGLARSIVASDRQGGVEELEHLIQTDAGVNPGNSGGPLLNLTGEVVGVNVAVAGDAENIGFALSANSVKSIVDSLR